MHERVRTSADFIGIALSVLFMLQCFRRSQYDLKMQNSHQKDSRVSEVQPTVRSDVAHPISLAKAVYSFRAQSPS